MNISNQKAFVLFNKLNVTNIENSSGIFIGNNQAIGWSSYGKTNQGFGSLSNSTLAHSVNVVYDQDAIDASIEDVRNIALTESASKQACDIEFHSINANAVSMGSAIDLGDNRQLGWRSSRKNNYGMGKEFGSNRSSRIANIVFDNDVVDAPFHNEGNILENVGHTERNIRISQKQPPHPGATNEIQ